MVSYTSIFALALAAIASAQDTSSSVSIPPNPATTLLTQTDANGVVTGQPAVVTSQPGQPALITSQPLAASLPALGDGTTTLTHGNQTYTVAVSGNSTSFISSTSTSSSTRAANATGTGASGSGGASSTNAATRFGAGALLGAGVLVALL